MIKQFLPPQQGTGNRERASALFRQEAQRLQELGNHAQIPALLDALEQAGQPYLVQTFIDGPNLAQALAEQGAFSEAQILQLLDNLFPILEFMHAHQVIHRDVKPANIIRQCTDQTLFLVDLGAAKYATGTALAQTGTVIGSAEYTAPEQARGKAVFASDLYSLGVTCIHLLTDVPPFDLFDNANGRWVWREFLRTPLLQARLGQILDKMLQAATNQRYQSAQAVRLDLAALRAPESRWLGTASSPMTAQHLVTETVKPEPLYQEGQDRAQWSVVPGGAITPGQRIPIAPLLDSRPRRRGFQRLREPLPVVSGLFVMAVAATGLMFWLSPYWYPTSPNQVPQFSLPRNQVRTLLGAKSLTSLALSPNGQTLVGGGYGTLSFWHLPTGTLNQTLSIPNTWIGAVAISPDGQTLVSTTDTGVVELRALPSGNRLRSLNDLTKAIAISPDGQMLASGSSGPDTSIKLWQLHSGTLSRILPGHQGTVAAVAFSPDGQTLASSSYDGSIRLWQVSDGKLLRTWHEPHQAGSLTWIEAVAISPDGQRLIASVSNTLKFWDLHSGTLLRTLTIGQVSPVGFQLSTLALSPNGQMIASGTYEGTVQLWDLHSGALLSKLRAHDIKIKALLFSADSKTLISSSEDGAIKIWSVEQLRSDH